MASPLVHIPKTFPLPSFPPQKSYFILTFTFFFSKNIFFSTQLLVYGLLLVVYNMITVQALLVHHCHILCPLPENNVKSNIISGAVLPMFLVYKRYNRKFSSVAMQNFAWNVCQQNLFFVGLNKREGLSQRLLRRYILQAKSEMFFWLSPRK